MERQTQSNSFIFFQLDLGAMPNAGGRPFFANNFHSIFDNKNIDLKIASMRSNC
jgi:hypothetical protein